MSQLFGCQTVPVDCNSDRLLEFLLLEINLSFGLDMCQCFPTIFLMVIGHRSQTNDPVSELVAGVAVRGGSTSGRLDVQLSKGAIVVLG